MTDEQLRRAPVDPSDGRTVAERLRDDVHDEVLAIIADGAALLARLARYANRLDVALGHVADGDVAYLARPAVDSYHTVWFELHEELINLAGTDRSAEAAAGRT